LPKVLLTHELKVSAFNTVIWEAGLAEN